ncbi:hypothetical protein P12x_005235 [Tundrisphaera lichenicola]|uniref:hypothetical protein n=1 Tax=Tundrisphaera lichenicola TaxID=2029860 RepID=UPI003EBA11DD
MTLLPGMGTKELAEMNRQREEAFRAMTSQEKRIAMGLAQRKRGRPATMTPEQKQERQREYQRNYQRERRERQKQA